MPVGVLLLPLGRGAGEDAASAGDAELLLPAGADGVGIAREGQEGTLDLVVGLGVLDHALGEAGVA
eukprot:4721106-Alexandrium_andersonii.AAC.1